MTDNNAGRDRGGVLSPLPGPPFRGPAYGYIRAEDRVPPLGAQDGAGTRRPPASSCSSSARAGRCSSASTTPPSEELAALSPPGGTPAENRAFAERQRRVEAAERRFEQTGKPCAWRPQTDQSVPQLVASSRRSDGSRGCGGSLVSVGDR